MCYNNMVFLTFCIVLSYFCTTVIGEPIPCTTPNGEKSTCISLFSCPILLGSACKGIIAKEFVEASVCATGTLQVCCGTLGNFTQKLDKEITNPLNESDRDYILRKNVLPTKKYCGLQHTDDYFYNKTETSVDEFPWLVYLGIPDDYINNYYLRKESNCVGVLISNRYVLTSYSDCFRLIDPPHATNYTIEMILGQHHIYNDVSCIPTQFGVDDCTNPNIRAIAYTWYIAPIYYLKPTLFDISIIRLDKKVEFSDFVRPICLPLDNNDIPKPGDIVTTSGWGEQKSVDGKNVKLKKRIKHNVMGKEECEKANPVLNPICGAPLDSNSNFVCPGDNGGPLMYKHQNNWIVTGIVSKTKTCDDVHPVIAEQLTPDTLDWMISTIAIFERKAEKSGE